MHFYQMLGTRREGFLIRLSKKSPGFFKGRHREKSTDCFAQWCCKDFCSFWNIKTANLWILLFSTFGFCLLACVWGSTYIYMVLFPSSVFLLMSAVLFAVSHSAPVPRRWVGEMFESAFTTAVLVYNHIYREHHCPCYFLGLDIRACLPFFLKSINYFSFSLALIIRALLSTSFCLPTASYFDILAALARVNCKSPNNLPVQTGHGLWFLSSQSPFSSCDIPLHNEKWKKVDRQV